MVVTQLETSFVSPLKEKFSGEVLTQVILHQSCENAQPIMSHPHGIQENLVSWVDTQHSGHSYSTMTFKAVATKIFSNILAQFQYKGK